MGEFLRQPLSDTFLIIIIFALVFGSRLIRTLTSHQQKMTEIIQRNQVAQVQKPNQEIESLKRDVDMLKATVNQQTMLLDTIANQQKEMLASLKQSDSIKQRLEQ